LLINDENVKREAQNKNLLWGTIDTWILWNLTNKKVHAIDYTQIASTGMWDPFSMTFNPIVLKFLSIPTDILPTVLNTSSHFGNCDPSIFGDDNTYSIPITSLCADQSAALFGQCCFEPGQVKVTIGTSLSVDMNVGCKAFASKYGLWPLLGWKFGEEEIHILEGFTSNAGSTLDWACSVGFISSVTETDALSSSVPNCNNVYFVPALTGLNQPWNNDFARGTIIGITRTTKKEHIARSLLEAIAFRVKDILECYSEDVPLEIDKIYVDGGVSQNDFLLQFMADFLQKPVDRAEQIEMTSQGVAFLAGLSGGFWKNKEELKKLRKTSKLYLPTNSMTQQEREEKYLKWKKAVNASLDWER